MPSPPPQFAPAGSQRWLQVAVNRAPELLDHALREAGAIEPNETLGWRSPLEAANFTEYRDATAFRALGIDQFPIRPLADFWPRRGPVWDGLAITRRGAIILLEAKAHIGEVLSPPSRAGGKSRARIIAALDEARQFYAPGSTTPGSHTSISTATASPISISLPMSTDCRRASSSWTSSTRPR